ncbi:relA-associated inhibitor [Electrophorus electricus]|uniref:relA-associated inhibitor n=1 Tax=Electrophorus electricus TaxID=8005 RepID=UPI0015CF91F8|nr:relA-associated inhibitor [Electrophorus electricus]
MSCHSGSNMLFQTITEDLNASLATADKLSQEFNSLLQEISSTEISPAPSSRSQAPNNASNATSSIMVSEGSFSSSSGRNGAEGISNRDTMSIFTPTEYSTLSVDSIITGRRTATSPKPQYTPPLARRADPESGYSRGQLTSPNVPPCIKPQAILFSYAEPCPLPVPKYNHQSLPSKLQLPTSPVAPISQTGRRSPRMDRVPSPNIFSQSAGPRNFMPFKPSDESIQKQRSPSKWNETDLDISYERKPHQTYDNNEWIRPSIPNSNWKESNLDSPTLPRKDPMTDRHPRSAQGSLPRAIRVSMTLERAPPAQVPYGSQPVISRISIPPSSPRTYQHRPIPLSVIMRLQNPYYAMAAPRYPLSPEGELDLGRQRQPFPLPRDYFYHFQSPPPEQRQPVYYGEVLSSSDVDAEVERLNAAKLPAIADSLTRVSEQGKEPKVEGSAEKPEPVLEPRPLSPTRLQPVVAPEAPVVPDVEAVLRLRAEIPRALKRRSSTNQSQSLKKLHKMQPNQYKQMIKKLFGRKGPQAKGEVGSEGSSSDGEESATLSLVSSQPLADRTPGFIQQRLGQGLQSILRKSKGSSVKTQSPRARLSPLVLLLDGALVGELDTVQRAVQEMSDPSQPNDEGITALHNAICGGHYAVVEFLVRIGANISAPDSHGWTPLHCAASCNDQAMCEFLVRNGAAVMAVTESDGATAAQKCDPFAPNYDECNSFLRGVEQAMGVENSGVLYALWSYPAQAPDELSFKEGDMVTILQRPDGVDWWWASLCGREGFVPNNYFGLFPKVRPKSLC